MAQKKEEIADRLSQEIFGKSWNHLSNDDKYFAYLHLRWYTDYRKKIARAARKAMDMRRLDGRKDYPIIFDWYCKRISLGVVLNSIKECETSARNQFKPIYSMNYFRKAVIRNQERTIEMCSPRQYVEGDNKWYYKLFCELKAGKFPGDQFDPFEGLVYG